MESTQHQPSLETAVVPRGRPDSIFFLPHLFDSEDYKTPVVSDEIDEFLNKSTMMCAEDFSKEFEEFSLKAMNS